MCGINIAIGGTQSDVQKMNDATKGRGIAESYRFIQYTGGTPTWICYNHLPTTQKTISGCGFETDNYVIWLNGFISNYHELAAKYKFQLTTKRDTEVLALCIENKVSLHELNGFFAVVVYDKTTKEFDAFTDRYGVKQLYYYIDNNGIKYISSEVKGIQAIDPHIEWDMTAIHDWHYSLGVMTNHTIYKGIGRISKLSMPIIERSTDVSLSAYAKAKLKLYELFNQAILRNRYDGPTGVYLSGGIDSGMLAKWIQPDYCFSVDYVEAEFSESELIKLNSVNNHIALIMNERMAKQYAAKTVDALDDLKAGSCYTNFAIAELASKYVQIVYSGAGGDEFFGGYPHRESRELDEVIRRNDNLKLQHFDISRFQYDLKFLESVLIVEDRMAGFHTMETRYPLLDNDLVNFALSLPMEFLENKRILKEISGLHPDVKAGKKRGFSNPYFTNPEWTKFVITNLNKGNGRI